MEKGAFTNKLALPDSRMISETLGDSLKFWETIKTSLENDLGQLVEEWKYYGKDSWWTMKLLYKKRNMFFFTPCRNYFRITFIFGDKAVAKIEKSDLPSSIIKEIRTAKKYVEGRGLTLEIKAQRDVKIVLSLAAIKIKN